MKKVRMIGLFILLFALMTACAKEIPNTNTANDNVIVLTKETIKGFEKGILIGTPLRLDKEIRLSDVEKVWGKYKEMYDHEDIHTFVYSI